MPEEVDVQEQAQQQGETPTDNSSTVTELPTYDEIGYALTDDLVAVIKSFSGKLPSVVIVKILQNLAADVMYQNILGQVGMQLKALESHLSNKSKLII